MAGWEALAQGAHDPFFARDCDGYPGLVAAEEPEPCACGDPGDCSGCGA